MLNKLVGFFKKIISRYYRLQATYRSEFMDIIRPLMENEMVQKLGEHEQHYKYTRLRHSLDVAYLSFFISKVFRLDSRSIARAGLLHDLFFHEEDQGKAALLFSHPRIAVQNARSICDLNKKEEDIILKHMFLLTPWPPRSAEGYVVTIIDKYCASREFLLSVFFARKITKGTAIVETDRVRALKAA